MNDRLELHDNNFICLNIKILPRGKVRECGETVRIEEIHRTVSLHFRTT